MPPRSLLRAFLVLWLVSAATLFYGSVETVREAWSQTHSNPHLALIGGIEAIAALLFVLPRTIRVGAAGLLVTITVAFLIHVATGQLRPDLLLYAAVVAFVAVRGPLTPAQLRIAILRPSTG